MVPKRIIWHHSADNSNENQFAKIDAYHKTRGFPISSLGYYVGYHFVIEKNGAVIKARMSDEIGAHDQGENPDSVGICLAGNFDIEMPTYAQELAFRVVLLELMLKWGITLLQIEPHRRDDQTSCPGKNLQDNYPISLL